MQGFAESSSIFVLAVALENKHALTVGGEGPHGGTPEA